MPQSRRAPIPARRAGFLDCVFAHWRHVSRPDRAARVVVAARGWQAASAVLLAVAELSAVLLFEIGAPLARAWPAVVLMILAFAWMAWVQMPQVHRTGLLCYSYWRSLCACSGAAGSMVGQMVVVPKMIMLLAGVRDAEPAQVLLVAAAGVLALRWFGRAVRGAPGHWTGVQAGPLCEGCGYDLTYRPADGRCPECGLEVAASLDPGRLRAGGHWATHRGPRAWATATWQIIFTPRWFYGRLRTHGGAARERAFSRWTYRAIALGALVFLLCCAVCARLVYGGTPPLMFFACLVTGFGLGAAVACWCGHRTIAAGVFTWWALREPLQDGRWAVKVIAYESAFLWVFCCYWGLLGTSFMLFDDWISRALGVLGRGWFAGAPAEPLAVVLGTCVLGAVWLWRYRIAHRAIRWSNF